MPKLPFTRKPRNRPGLTEGDKRRLKLNELAQRKSVTGSSIYYTHSWRKLSKRIRSGSPCTVCGAEGVVAPSDVTDHAIPMSAGGAQWDEGNLWGMCDAHHNRKRAYESQGWVAASKPSETEVDLLVPLDYQEIVDKLVRPGFVRK